jgi:hypothetical protein
MPHSDKHSIDSPSLRFSNDNNDQLGWHHDSSSLIGFLWLQFADAIATNRIFKPCAQCKRWFEISQESARNDKLYCSRTCRVRVYRARQAEARRLFAEGTPVGELAERFGSDPETIEAWVGFKHYL